MDYEPRSLKLTVKPLTDAGFKVEVANDGLAGLEAFEELKPDLVLIEAMIPKKHGFEVCQEIKKSAHGIRTPVIITTAVYRGRKYRTQALHIYGCDEYLEKPFPSEKLLEVCWRLLGEEPPPAEAEAHEPGSSDTVETSSQPATVEIPSQEEAPSLIPITSASPIVGATEEEIMARLDAILPGENADLGTSSDSETIEPEPAPKTLAKEKPSQESSAEASEEPEGFETTSLVKTEKKVSRSTPSPKIEKAQRRKRSVGGQAEDHQVIPFQARRADRPRRKRAPVAPPSTGANRPGGGPGTVQAAQEQETPSEEAASEPDRVPAAQQPSVERVSQPIQAPAAQASFPARKADFTPREVAPPTGSGAKKMRALFALMALGVGIGLFFIFGDGSGEKPLEPAAKLDSQPPATRDATRSTAAPSGAEATPYAPPPAVAEAGKRALREADRKTAGSGAGLAARVGLENEAAVNEKSSPAEPAADAKSGQPGETATGEEGAFEPGQVVSPPVPKTRNLPAYTTLALGLQQEGTVILHLLINEKGQVEGVDLVRGIPGSDLNEASVEASRRWTYEPALKDGKPVKVWVTEELVFEL